MTNYQDTIDLMNEVASLKELVKRIQDVLGTAEIGEALIEVARNAHRAELELAFYHNFDDPFTIEGNEGAI